MKTGRGVFGGWAAVSPGPAGERPERHSIASIGLVGSRLLLIMALLHALVDYAVGQGTFQNLSFEAANIVPPNQAGLFQFSQVFPGWTGYIGTNQAPVALLNGLSLGGAVCSLITRYTPSDSNAVISGTYTAVISVGEDQIINNSPEIIGAALAQNGMIPTTARSIGFSVGSMSYLNSLLVTFNGQEIPIFPSFQGANFTFFLGDVSSFAGQSGELRFSSLPAPGPFGNVFLDNIQFSNQPIPEPSSVCLFCLGALLFGWRLLSRRH